MKNQISKRAFDELAREKAEQHKREKEAQAQALASAEAVAVEGKEPDSVVVEGEQAITEVTGENSANVVEEVNFFDAVVDSQQAEVTACTSLQAITETDQPALVETQQVEETLTQPDTTDVVQEEQATESAVEVTQEQTDKEASQESEVTLVPAVADVVETAPTPYADKLKEVTPQWHHKLEELNDYIEAMAAGKIIDERAGALKQVRLYRILTYFINNDSIDYVRAMDSMLDVINKDITAKGNKSVFDDRYINRFVGSMNIHDADKQARNRLISMFVFMADPMARKNVGSKIDLNKTLEHGVTQIGHRNFINYISS